MKQKLACYVSILACHIIPDFEIGCFGFQILTLDGYSSVYLYDNNKQCHEAIFQVSCFIHKLICTTAPYHYGQKILRNLQDQNALNQHFYQAVF